jgi:Domain of unknown function (DUF4193)
VNKPEQAHQEEQEAQEPAEASLDEMLAKKAEEGATAEENGEDETVAPTGSAERVETLTVKVVPQQPTEFVCKKCFLVRHRSQLADKKRMFCRDCV